MWASEAVFRGGLKRRIERALAEPGDQDASSEATSSTNPLRGPLRRRLARAEGPEAMDPDDLPLVESLKRRWADGKITSPLVQEFADAASRQGAEGMRRLASAGTSGRHPQNIQRSLLSFFGTPIGAPGTTWVRPPMRNGGEIHLVLLPHEFFGKLYAEPRPRWEEWIRGPYGAAKAFWDHLRSSSIVREHPALNAKRLHQALPIRTEGLSPIKTASS